MNEEQPNNPLHGITLEQIITTLVEHYGWGKLSTLINIQCFYNDPSIRSSLKFLRRNLSARERVEALYIATQKDLRGDGSAVNF